MIVLSGVTVLPSMIVLSGVTVLPSMIVLSGVTVLPSMIVLSGVTVLPRSFLYACRLPAMYYETDVMYCAWSSLPLFFKMMYPWWSLCSLYLLACHVTPDKTIIITS